MTIGLKQFLESFVQERARGYAQAADLLAPVYAKYFGEPLSKRASDFVPHARANVDFEDVKETAAAATVVTRERFGGGDIHTRFHLAVVGEGWRIIRIDRQCFSCERTGRVGGSVCMRCHGVGWYDPREGRA